MSTLRLRAVLAASAVLTLCACAAPASLIAVPTQSPPPGAGTPGPCPASIIEGVLVASDDWGIALSPSNETALRKVIWPYGFAARADADRLALLDDDGGVVARTGDLVRVAGGEVTGGTWLACGGVFIPAGP